MHRERRRRVGGDGGGGGGPTDKSSRHRSVTNEPAPFVNYPRLNSRHRSHVPVMVCERVSLSFPPSSAGETEVRREVATGALKGTHGARGGTPFWECRSSPEAVAPINQETSATSATPYCEHHRHAVTVECKSQRTRFFEQRKILGEKCALARGKYQTYLEMFEHSPREVCARIRKSGEIQILRFDYP
ncbi:Uncharacterized protein DBV15_05391 [Temnothorax longispinosus]|uniref:Uncharacterized protein n=1 Tax=Temnothorax longispinosus TaxID=300112 RepID=A0A4S2JC52_9HYME|nr:Uncharacterized protein DBV15_05391 [Temnothorax longispinosus]